MKYIYGISFFILFISTNAFAQTCLQEGVTFASQESVDNFPSDYPGCINVLGNVR